MRYPPRPYQENAIQEIRAAWRERKRRIVLVAPTGSGKCLGRDTPVLMLDGRIVPVQEIRAGDQLMGPDSQPRTVMSTTEGYGPLYEVRPVKGDTWVCNEHHILTLINTSTSEILDVPVQKWITSTKWFRHLHKQFMVPVDYGISAPLPLDPYFVGLWLGDDRKNANEKGLTSVAVTKPDREIEAYLRALAHLWKSEVRKNDSHGTRCPTWFIVTERGKTNPLLNQLRSLVGVDIQVPRSYLTASRDDRLQMLAGWLDSDGHLSNGYFEVAQKREDHSDALCQLARSLGFRVVRKTKIVNQKPYQRMTISGDFAELPTIIPRKQATERKQIKDVKRTGISVVPLDEGPYYGFEIDGDGRFLLGDFTVTHNTYMASTIIDGATAKGNRVLFLAHRKELIDQCSKTLDEIGVDHGVIKSGHWRKRPEKPVQVASIRTLYSKIACLACKDRRKAQKEILAPQFPDKKIPKDAITVACEVCGSTGRVHRPFPEAQIVVIDETHRCLAPTYQEVLKAYPEALVLGLTATPWRLDRRGLGRMYEHMVVTTDVQDLVDQGFLLPLRVYAPDLPDLSGVHTRGGDYASDELSAVMGSDKLVGNIVDHWFRLGEGRRTVVFASSVENSKHLVDRFREAGVSAEHLDGTTSDPVRDAILERLADGTTRVVCNVDVLVEGYDLPSLGCVVLARPTKSLTRFLQQVGRGMRPQGDQTYMVLLDHAACVHEHGLPTDPRRWTLADRSKKDRKKGPQAVTVKCEKCGALRAANVEICPSCAGIQIAVFRGILHERDENLVQIESTYHCSACGSSAVRLKPWGDLEIQIKCRSCKETSYEVDRQAAKHASEDLRRREFDRLRRVQIEKGFKSGWISHRYRHLFGTWPPAEWRS